MSTKRKKATHRRRSGSVQPSSTLRTNQSQRMPSVSVLDLTGFVDGNPRRDIELVPSAVENEVVARWQDFADEHGLWVEQNHRVPNISEFNQEMPWELAFAMPQPTEPAESRLWAEFVATSHRGQTVQVESRTFTAYPKNIFLVGEMNFTGWHVVDDLGNTVRPADLDWCRDWAFDSTGSVVYGH